MPVTIPGATVVAGVLIPITGLVLSGVHDGILQQEGSEGSGTREQDTGTLLNTAHLWWEMIYTVKGKQFMRQEKI